MSVNKTTIVFSSVIFAGTAGIPLSTVGQTVGQEIQEVEEVVVTAQRREQSILEVPVSLELLTEEKLAGLSDARDLYQVSPSLVYVGGVASSTQALNIRGVGGGAHVSAFEPSVTVVVDQVSTGPGGAALVDFWDVARIEVLNGPQGTLFGKNVSAGMLNIVTNDPTDEFEMKGLISYEGEYEEYRVEGVLNGPLTDNLNARLAFYGLDEGEGTLQNLERGTEDNTKSRYGVRLKTAYDQEALEFNMALSFERQDNDCCSRAITVIDPAVAGGLTNGFLVPAIQASGMVVDDENTHTISDGVAYEDTETFHGVWELAWELDSGHTVKSITGYRNWDQAEWNDVDAYPNDFIRGGLTHEMQLFTEEIQFVSPSGGDLEYLLGFYYYNMDLDEQTILEGCSTVCTALFASPTPLFFKSTWTSNVKVENIAVFGDVTYKFSDKWTGFAGARLLREDITVRGDLNGNFVFWPVGDFPEQEASNEDTDWMGRVGLQYYPTENAMVYGSYSRGYKGSGINNSINGQIWTGDPEEAVLDPETVDNFEIGVKLSALDNRATLTATAFFSEFKGFQASAFDGSSGFILRNAGVLQSSGLELGFDGSLWEGGALSVNMAYVDAEFDEFLGAPCAKTAIAAGTCVDATGGQDLSGEPVNRSPKWRYTIAGQQSFNLGSASAYVRLEYMWRDENILDGDLDPNTFQGSYGLVNARVAVAPTENLEIALWGRNLADEVYCNAIFDMPLWDGAYGCYPGKLRQVGAEIIARF